MPTVSTNQLRDWVSRAQAGDAGVQSLLLTHAQGRLRAMARKRLRGDFAVLRDHLDTGDVVGDLSAKMLERWDRLFQDAEGDPLLVFFRRTSRWMCDILVSAMRHRYGRDGNRPSFQPLAVASPDESAVSLDPRSETDDPLSLAMWTEMQTAMTELPERLADVFCLRWFHDMSHGEIAEALGIAEVTVRVRWTEARLALRKRFPDLSFEEEA
jgi:RNA polymerase sigma factor (sigma-70 family)